MNQAVTWKDVLNRFKSPVVTVSVILMVVNTLRIVLGWDFPVMAIEAITNILVYIVGGTFATLNNPENKSGF